MIRQQIITDIVCDGRNCFANVCSPDGHVITAASSILQLAAHRGWRINLKKNLHLCPTCKRKK